MIPGDSLLVMTSLAEKEGLKGKVQTIYMDPPYGIKFGSNWQVSTRTRDVKDGKAEDATLKMRVIGSDNFGHMILDNLKKAGVQNNRTGERRKFDAVDVFPGDWIHGVGTYTERRDPQITQMDADSKKKENLRKSAQSAASPSIPPSARKPIAMASSSSCHQDESRPGHGRRTAQKDRRRQPLHGLRRARRGD